MASRKSVVIMVGLPARGKTFLSLRLQRYLEWQGYRARIFNVGAYRRDILGLDSSRSSFFDPHIEAYARAREKIAKRCFSDLTVWLEKEGDIAIYDATNVTPERRGYLAGQCLGKGLDYIFVENICDKSDILERIVEVKVGKSADYRNNDMEAARKDFRERIGHYEGVYETIGEDLPYIKIFNFGEKVKRNFKPGPSIFDEIAEFLGAINLSEKNIYITRHGETFFNTEDRIGGDSSLTDRGVEFASRLGAYFEGKELVVLTSTKRRTMETAGFFDCEKVRLEELNEISSGVCDSLTYGEVAAKYPEIDSERNADKFNFRYPGGESYRDMIQRVKKAVVRIESGKKDVLVIAHRAVNRCLFAYFIPIPHNEIPYIDMPLNRVIRIHNKRALYDYESILI